jgi:hypothetical protein
MAPHGGAESYPKGPGPSRKRPKKTVGATGTAGMAGPSPPPKAKILELNLTPLWAHFGFARTSPAWPTDPPPYSSPFIHETSSTRRRLYFAACKRVGTTSSTTFPSMRRPLQLQSNCSRVSMLDIEADHIEVARRRSSPPNISHSQWLSTVRGTRQSARWQFAILHTSTERHFSV